MAVPDTVLMTYLGVSHQSPEEQVLRLLVELGAQFVGAKEGSLLVFDEEAGDMVFAMTVGAHGSEEVLAGQRVPIGRGVTGLAAQTREVQIGAPAFKTEQPEVPRLVLAAPMLIGDRLVGVITAVSFEAEKRFTAADAKLYGRIAAVAGVVVELRRRLSTVEALQRGEPSPEALNEEERLERRIAESVARLVQAKPEVKARVADLLAGVEALLAE